nr:hypothetical protein CFP56_53382 [Quercus suber]
MPAASCCRITLVGPERTDDGSSSEKYRECSRDHQAAMGILGCCVPGRSAHCSAAVSHRVYYIWISALEHIFQPSQLRLYYKTAGILAVYLCIELATSHRPYHSHVCVHLWNNECLKQQSRLSLRTKVGFRRRMVSQSDLGGIIFKHDEPCGSHVDRDSNHETLNTLRGAGFDPTKEWCCWYGKARVHHDSTAIRRGLYPSIMSSERPALHLVVEVTRPGYLMYGPTTIVSCSRMVLDVRCFQLRDEEMR